MVFKGEKVKFKIPVYPDPHLNIVSVNRNGRLIQEPENTPMSMMAILHQCGINIAYNEMTRFVEFSDLNGEPNGITLNTIESAVGSGMQQHGLNDNFVRRHILGAAKLNSYHPAAWLLGNTEWDKVDRVNEWVDGMNLGTEDERGVMKLTLKTIARTWYGGISFKFMPVIYSAKNNYRKTSLVRMLGAGIPGGAVTGQYIDHSRDNLMVVLSGFVTEVGELESTLGRKAETGKLKSLIDNDCDILRPPYGRSMERYERRTVFISTSNLKRVIKDETLVSRLPYLNLLAPIEVEKMQVLMGLSYNRDNAAYEIVDVDQWRQFWAQVREMPDPKINRDELLDKGKSENLEDGYAYDLFLDELKNHPRLSSNKGFRERDVIDALPSGVKLNDVREALRKAVRRKVVDKRIRDGYTTYYRYDLAPPRMCATN